MKRFRSLKDIEKERYRLYLEKELAGYKLEYFFRNTRKNFSAEKFLENSVGNWFGRTIGRLIRKKNNP